MRASQPAWGFRRKCGVLYVPYSNISQQQTLVNIRGELSAEKRPTIQKVYPLLEKLQHEWEGLLDNVEYSLFHEALEAGLKNMKKWFRAAGQSGI